MQYVGEIELKVAGTEGSPIVLEAPDSEPTGEARPYQFILGSGQALEDVENATVFFEGKTIPVSAFAHTEFGTGLAAVHRIDARRVVTVSAEVAAERGTCCCENM